VSSRASAIRSACDGSARPQRAPGSDAHTYYEWNEDGALAVKRDAAGETTFAWDPTEAMASAALPAELSMVSPWCAVPVMSRP
jgi:YD repeat-containing protein